MNKDKKENLIAGAALVGTIILAGGVIIGLGWGLSAICKQYNVWSQGMVGKAELSRADWNRQIVIKEAQAKQQASIALAQAEVDRAKGVAQANKIIGQSLQNNEAYLRYLWINNLQNDKNQVIYVPTEANLPILEANRLKK